MIGYYRKFIRGFGIISRPLTKLLKKNSFKWNQNSKMAFERLKTSLYDAPVLALPDFIRFLYWELMFMLQK